MRRLKAIRYSDDRCSEMIESFEPDLAGYRDAFEGVGIFEIVDPHEDASNSGGGIGRDFHP